MGRKRNRRELAEAWAVGHPVMARRNLWKADHLEGYVVEVAQDWAALHLVYDVCLNGWSAVRLDTLREVDRQGPDAFITRALALTGDEPEAAELDLAGPAELIRSAASRFPLVTIYTEAADPGVCAIGRPVRITARHVEFLDISSEGVWADRSRRLRLEDVTRVDVGARYEAVLHELGGYPPVP